MLFIVINCLLLSIESSAVYNRLKYSVSVDCLSFDFLIGYAETSAVVLTSSYIGILA